KSGDTLWGISQQTGIPLSELFRLNGLGPASTIYPGQRIILRPAGSAPSPGAGAPTTGGHLAGASPAAPSAAPQAAAPQAATAAPPVNPQIAAATGPSWWNEVTARQKTMWGVSEKTGLTLDQLFAGQHVPTASGTETPAQIQAIVRQTAASMGVPAALALAIAEQESSFRQNVTSPVGAIGVMQIMPANATWVSSLAGRPLDLRNTADNVAAGVAMLRWLLQQAPTQDIAIAGYYQGLYGVQAYGMYPDTKAYVAQVKQRMAKYA
ncbi:MAG: transglycosylase SLT domain-containing protein, partial [Sinomonas sp.]|nr:transglycosylase SLT domain-containing protein [Sinomonas sp.]